MRNVVIQLRSKGKLTLACLLAASFTLALAAGIFGWRQSITPTVQASSAKLNGEAAVEQLKKDGSYNSLAAAMTAARYQVARQGDHWLAENPSQQFSASFTPKEIRIADLGLRNDKRQSTKPNWEFNLKLKGFGYGDELPEVGQGETIANGERIEIRKSGITEWYVNKAEGLEQGFTLNTPPTNHQSSATDDRLHLALQVTGNLRAEMTADNQAVTLKDRSGRDVLSYNKLAAWDADGKLLAATMKASGQEIMLEVDDREARYPVTIDPMISLQNKLTAADGAAQDKLGTSVSMKGSSVVAGAPGDNSGKGAAYVFAGSGSSWTQAKLTAPDGSTGDTFGWSVAIDGTTAVVGAPFDDSQRGSAYVFVYANGLWSYQTRLNASDSSVGDGDRFGWSVSLSGNSVIVGAYQDDGNAGQDQGAAYVFVRTGTTWTQQQKLASTDIAAGDLFGHAVAINGDTAVITADQNNINNNVDQGSAYVFKRNGSVWSQQQTLVASDAAANDRFGSSVAISGATIMVGCAADDIGNNQDQGSAYVFAYNGSIWLQQSKLLATDGAANDYFGASVDLSGDIAVAGAYGKNSFQGAAYAYARNGAVWSQRQILSQGDGAAGDFFGGSVSVDGNTMVSGAPVGGNINQGAAYVYMVCTDLGQLQKITRASGLSNDRFGKNIVVSGDTAVIASVDLGSNGGALYFFTQMAANNWVLTQKITPSNLPSGSNFANGLAIDGNTLVVGASFDNYEGLNQGGSVLIYTRNGNTWSLNTKFNGSDTVAGDWFGMSVAISGNTIVVGAPYCDIAGATNQGAAYVFVRNGQGQWVQEAKLTGTGPNADDQAGWGVAIEGDMALLGSRFGDLFGVENRGTVTTFKRNNGAWTRHNLLFASDGGVLDGFGWTIQVNNGTAVIGAPFARAAYVYVFNGVNWVSQQKLPVPADTIAIEGDTIVVGDVVAAINGNDYQGTASLFQRTGGTWGLQKQFVASDGSANDYFGISVAINHGAILIGADFDDIGSAVDTGSAYVFGCVSCPTISITTGALPNGAVGGIYGQPLAASGGSGTYQFSLSGGNLPPGLLLIQNGTIVGTPTTAGTYTFTVTATTPELCTGSKNFSITINGSCPSFTLNPATLPNGTINTVYNQTLQPTGGTAPYLFSHSGTLPPGVQLNSQTGVLLGVATTAGTFDFTVTATDINFCQGSKAYSVTIGQNAGVSANNLQFYPLAHPVRLLDTRSGQTGCDAPGAKIPGGSSRQQTAAGRTCDGMAIPANAAALMGNVTTVQSGGGYLTLYPSDIAKPLAANSNYAANQILNNLFTVRLGANDGAFKIFVSTDTDVVVDITGYYAPPAAGGLYFHPLPKPVRLLDTRAGATGCFTPGQILQAGSTMTQLGQTTCDGVLIPPGVQALVGNATTTNQQANGFMTMYPADAAQPLAASSNFQAGINMNAPFMVGLSPSGQFNIFTASTTNVVIDVIGYYSTQMNDSNGQGLLFNSLAAPVRLLDTRASQTACFTPSAQMVGGTAYLQTATGACTTIPATAQSVVGNATTLNATANSYLTFWPSDANQPYIATSNYRTNQVFNRHFTVGLGPDGAFKRFAASTTDLVIDLCGYFAP